MFYLWSILSSYLHHCKLFIGFLFIATLSSSWAAAQSMRKAWLPNTINTTTNPKQLPDSAYQQRLPEAAHLLPRPFVREADVAWSKKMWRDIAVNHPQNRRFVENRHPLLATLLDIARQNPTKARIYADEQFSEPISYDKLMEKLQPSVWVVVTDPDTDKQYVEQVQNDFNQTTIVKFRLKEEWFFDIKNGAMQASILGIAPIREVYDSLGNYRGEEPLFWAYFPDFERELSRYTAYFEPDIAQAPILSWNDVLTGRYFNSQVYNKIPNTADQSAQGNSLGLDSQNEKAHLRKSISAVEQALWRY